MARIAILAALAAALGGCGFGEARADPAPKGSAGAAAPCPDPDALPPGVTKTPKGDYLVPKAMAEVDLARLAAAEHRKRPADRLTFAKGPMPLDRVGVVTRREVYDPDAGPATKWVLQLDPAKAGTCRFIALE